jgi:hypothetical protein
MMANVRAERLLKIPAEPSPELRIPALQLKRGVSLAGIRFGSWESARARLVSPAQAEILAYARAAYPQRRSSNASGLQSQNSAGFPQICAIFQRDNLRRHF